MERETPTVPETSTQIDVKLAAVGVVSGIVAAMAMDSFSRFLRALNGGRREVPGATPGGERDAKGAQPAQAKGSGDQDATVKVGTAAFEAVTGQKPGRETQQWLGTLAHYGFGAAMGVNYMLASEQAPDLRRGYGTVYGSLVWAAADEGVLPAAGLSKKTGEIPLGVHAYALGAHWIYGATLETCRRVAAAVLDAWDRSGNVVDVTAEPVPVTPASGAAGAAGPT
jgi:putative membrane protein